MAFLTVGKENTNDVQLYFEDHGMGDTLVMIHGYPFSGTAWEKQVAFFVERGYRVITYDRRGFGLSSKTAEGYDYDTFANDLDQLMTKLDLKNVTLVGHSMGSGEIVRYVSRYGSERVRSSVLVSPLQPYLLDGVDQSVFDGFKKEIREDRYAFITSFLKNFYNLGLLSKDVSEEKLRADFNLASISSPVAFLKCVDTWTTDFRADLPRLNVPVLVIQGDKDQVLPIEATGKLLPDLLTNARLEVIAGGSHGIPWTHADEISEMILGFLNQGVTQKRPGLEIDARIQ